MQNPQPGKPRAFFKRRDIVVALCLLAAGLAALLLLRLNAQGEGLVARVSIEGDTGGRTLLLGLAEDRVEHIDAALPVQLEIKDGAIRFVHSACPDHDCEGFGWLRREGDWAACLPAGVVLTLEAEG